MPSFISCLLDIAFQYTDSKSWPSKEQETKQWRMASQNRVHRRS